MLRRGQASKVKGIPGEGAGFLETEWGVAETQGHWSRTWRGKGIRLLQGCYLDASASPQEQVPGTELLCRLDYLAPI